MNALILSAAILAGAGASHGMGEEGIGWVASAEVRGKYIQVEGLYSTQDKYYGEGWFAYGAVDAGNVIFARYRYNNRNGGDWTKKTHWFGAGTRLTDHFRVTVEKAFGGYNEEMKLEARYRGQHQSGVIVELRGFMTTHIQGTGYGATVLVGWGN